MARLTIEEMKKIAEDFCESDEAKMIGMHIWRGFLAWAAKHRVELFDDGPLDESEWWLSIVEARDKNESLLAAYDEYDKRMKLGKYNEGRIS